MIVQCEQRSATWFANRIGRCTASEISNVMAMKWVGSKERGDKKLIETVARSTYRHELVTEILTGECDMEGFNSKSMQWGELNEPLARSAYELKMGVLVDLIGFGIHDGIPRLGASPDAFAGDLGLIEIKCLKSKNHLEILKTDDIEEYLPQMYTNMAVFDKDWCDFVAFDPRFPQDELKIYIKRVFRDEARIKEIESATEQFLEEADRDVEWLQRKYGPFPIGKPEPVAEIRDTRTDEEWLEDFSGGGFTP